MVASESLWAVTKEKSWIFFPKTRTQKDNFIEYKNENNEKLSVKEYLENDEPYLCDIKNDLKLSDNEN